MNRFLHRPNRQCGSNTMEPLPILTETFVTTWTFGQQWIGRGGPVRWPARSPDLSCLDFYFWGHMKSLVYDTPVDNAEELVARIAVAAGEIRNSPGVFQNVRMSMRRRYESPDPSIPKIVLRDLIISSKYYKEEEAKELLEVITAERLETEQQQKLEQQEQLSIEKLRLEIELSRNASQSATQNNG
ncbi:uncharacterized protein TNCV_2561361 [Trichonephila clavipes]|uniref:Uncharacterized protein n=1 Tax=Trichonephila clavipes TaxID=2585209 RepID=A0A8X6R542_TRICX|nr:uncharacterized protein TNCV_2561361 [Trichonephila clavipes]